MHDWVTLTGQEFSAVAAVGLHQLFRLSRVELILALLEKTHSSGEGD
jgi:hypothetical protein